MSAEWKSRYGTDKPAGHAMPAIPAPAAPIAGLDVDHDEPGVESGPADKVFDDLMKSVSAGKTSAPSAPPAALTTSMSSAFKSGRGPTGKLRNFKMMSDLKFKDAHFAILSENNDPEAIEAINAEWERRFGVDEAWSDESRAAALYARRHHLHGKFVSPLPLHSAPGPWGFLSGTESSKDIRHQVKKLQRRLAALSPAERQGTRGTVIRGTIAALVGERQYRRMLPSAIMAARLEETRQAIAEATDHAEIVRLRAREAVLAGRLTNEGEL